MIAHKKGGRYCKRKHEYTPENTYINRNGIRECRTCGRIAKDDYKRRHADKVRQAARVWASEKITVRCPDCDESRLVARKTSQNTGFTYRCSGCAMESRRENQRRGKLLTCPHCGDSFWRTNSYLAHRKLGYTAYCSVGCRMLGGGYGEYGLKLSVLRKGRGNPNYRHGNRLDEHVAIWNTTRKGEKKCRNCGSWDRVQLHHAIPRSQSQAAKHDLRNGLPLCWTCHHGWHAHTLVIYRDIFTAEEWNYLKSVDLVDRLTEPWLDDHYPQRSDASLNTRARLGLDLGLDPNEVLV